MLLGTSHGLVEVHVEDTTFRVYDSTGELLASIPEIINKEIIRYRTYGWRDNIR